MSETNEGFEVVFAPGSGLRVATGSRTSHRSGSSTSLRADVAWFVYQGGKDKNGLTKAECEEMDEKRKARKKRPAKKR